MLKSCFFPQILLYNHLWKQFNLYTNVNTYLFTNVYTSVNLHTYVKYYNCNHDYSVKYLNYV